jgi:hypothetical protein
MQETGELGSKLVRLAARLILEDALGRGYYVRGAVPGAGYRNGYRTGRLKTAEGAIDYSAPLDRRSGGAVPFENTGNCWEQAVHCPLQHWQVVADLRRFSGRLIYDRIERDEAAEKLAPDFFSVREL